MRIFLLNENFKFHIYFGFSYFIFHIYLGLEVLSDSRKIAAALFVRDILCRRIESAYLADLLRFVSNPYPRRRNARLMDFYHRTNYGQNEPINKAI
jgi:hypothetical protein